MYIAFHFSKLKIIAKSSKKSTAFTDALQHAFVQQFNGFAFDADQVVFPKVGERAGNTFATRMNQVAQNSAVERHLKNITLKNIIGE